MPEFPSRVLSFAVEGVLQPQPLSAPDRAMCWAPALREVLLVAPDVQLLCHAPRLAAQAQENLGQLFGQRLLGWLPSQGQPYETVQTWATQHAPAAKLLMLDSDRRAYPREAEWDLLICEPHLGVNDPDILGAIEAWLLWSGWNPPA